jgi:cell division protease FtsH
LLLEKEVIFKDDLQEIFGKRPFDEEEEVAHTTIKEEQEKPAIDKISEE